MRSQILDDAFSRLEAHANEAATGHNDLPHPTPAQAAAGNYKLGRVTLHGMPIRIENPRNSVRSGTDGGGKAWSCRMAAHYGYFAGTKGADGDGVDVFVGPFPESTSAWVINQRAGGGAFDEHKVMLAFHTEEQARSAYLGSYSPGWRGLMSVVPASVSQVKWWLANGDKARALTADQLPFEGKPMMDRVHWDADAMPRGDTLAKVLYKMRAHDAGEGLMLDAVTMDEIMADPDLEPAPMFDALNVEVGMLKRKMDQVLRVMQRASSSIKPTDVTISDPVKSRGVLQIAVLFAMSDGQAVTIWFHNPDTTPNRLTPMDWLVSWKWMLNKKDITIVVAPERGKDLNINEVARRIMRLVERNSEGFAKANAKAAERAEQTAAVTTEITQLETRLGDLEEQITTAKAKQDAAAAEAAAGPAWKRLSREQVTTEDGYRLILGGGEVALLYWQDVLDSFFQGRYIDVRNALRALGWDGENYGTLSKDGHELVANFKQLGGGRNIVGMSYGISGVPGFFMSDPLSRTAEELASMINLGIPAATGGDGGEDGVQPATVDITGDEFGAFSDDKAGVTSMRAVARAAYEAMLGQTVRCPALGADVVLRRSGLNKVMSMSADPRKLKILAKIKDVIASSKRLRTRAPYNAESDTSAKAYHIMRAEINLGGQPLAVRLVIKEDQAGNFHYDHTIHAPEAIFDDAKANGPAQADPSTTGASNGRGTGPSSFASGLRGGIVFDDATGVNSAEIVNLEIEGEAPEAVQPDADAVPAVDARTPMERWAAELAQVLQSSGFAAYAKARDQIGVDNSLDANQVLDLGRLVEGIVGPELMTLERAKHDPYTQGQKAWHRGESPLPPEGLSDEQRAQWLAGWQERQDNADAAKPDLVEPGSTAELADALRVIGFTPAGSMSWTRAIESMPGLFSVQVSAGWIVLEARGQKLWESESGSLSTADAVAAIRGAVESFEAGMDEDADPAAVNQFAPFDMAQLKMPTAVQLGFNILGKILVWEEEGGTLSPGWSNGFILDVASRPTLVKNAIAKYSVDVNGLKRIASEKVDAVVSKTKGNTIEVTPIALDNSESVTHSSAGEKRTPVNGVVMVNEEKGESVTINRFALAYFAKTYKGCTFLMSAAPGAFVLVKFRGQVVGVIAPITGRTSKYGFNMAKRAVTRAQIEATDPVKKVDDAYQFDQATERFKTYIAETVDEVDFSMFATAKVIDQAAKANGATVSWDVDSGVVLDAVAMEGDDLDGGLFDGLAGGGAETILDAAEGSTAVVGKISKGGDLLARAVVVGDGKAMIYMGESGTQRVMLGDQTAPWTEDGAALVAGLFAPQASPDPEPAQENGDASVLRAILAGSNDDTPLSLTLATIEAAVNALNESGMLVGDVEQLSQDAITYWAKLDEKVNG